MEKSQDPRFTGILLFAGLWNICLATWALFFTEVFFQVFGFNERGNALEMGQKILWVSVGVIGILFIISSLNNARFRFVIAIAVPGKALAFFGTISMFVTGQAGVGIIFIGVGDLLFTIPFILYLRATKHLGWV